MISNTNTMRATTRSIDTLLKTTRISSVNKSRNAVAKRTIGHLNNESHFSNSQTRRNLSSSSPSSMQCQKFSLSYDPTNIVSGSRMEFSTNKSNDNNSSSKHDDDEMPLNGYVFPATTSNDTCTTTTSTGNTIITTIANDNPTIFDSSDDELSASTFHHHSWTAAEAVMDVMNNSYYHASFKAA